MYIPISLATKTEDTKHEGPCLYKCMITLQQNPLMLFLLQLRKIKATLWIVIIKKKKERKKDACHFN